MKGIELARSYFNEYGKAMLEEDFPEQHHLIAVGLVGSGSECLGYDDDISTDHDFEPGFCIFLPDYFTSCNTLKLHYTVASGRVSLFLWLSGIPLHGYTTFVYSFIYQ